MGDDGRGEDAPSEQAIAQAEAEHQGEQAIAQSDAKPLSLDLEQIVADARAKLPQCYEKLRAAGFEGPRLDYTIARLATFDIEDELLVRALFEDAPRDEDQQALAVRTAQSSARQRLTIMRHSLVRWYRRRGLVNRIFYLGGWLAALLGPTIASGLTWLGGIGIGAVVLMRLRNAWKDFDPDTIPILEQNHEQRQLLLEEIVHTMQQWTLSAPTPREILKYQNQVLQLITSYVRDHRSEVKERKIFANLIVRYGSVAAVIARSDYQRKVPEYYKPEECSVAWRALMTGAPQMTGDVYLENPQTRPGKRYSSILALPIKLEHRTLGVVSIDSEGKYHFDRVLEPLQNELAPYVQLLAISLPQDHDHGRKRETGDGGISDHS